MAKTRKPCPGCGEADQWARRDADQVCGSCRKRLDLADRIEKILAARTEAVKFPYQSMGLDAWRVNWDLRREMQSTLRELIEVISLPSFRTEWDSDAMTIKAFHSNTTDGQREAYSIAQFPPGTGAILQRLVSLLDKAIEDSWKQGRIDGSRFISRLAEGELSVADFNEGTDTIEAVIEPPRKENERGQEKPKRNVKGKRNR